MGVHQFLTALVFGVSSVYAAVSSTGFTVSLNDISYFLPPKPIAKIDCKTSFDGSFLPFTVFQGTRYRSADISSLTAQYLEADDVFQEGFLEAVYISGGSAPALNASTTIITGAVTGELKPGPYFMNTAGQVFGAWRLYSDTQGAFLESAIGNGDGTYSALPAGIVGQHLAIAVPSRLYFEKTDEKPLAGVRIGIKDIYDIKGLRTSNGNRAWYWLYPPANNTAPPVQNLIDAGAIIIGKMLTSQFANGEVATADWVDYHEAFNPRGDGYQDTSSSSSGGGAGPAAYPWLDVALGSDTGGSVRGPAQVQGLYGNRPSHGLVTLDHVMPLSPVLDTAGLLARNPSLWKEAAKAMYKSNITFSNNYPSKITTLGFPTSAEDVASSLLIDFLGNVTSFLKTNATAYNITTAWTDDNPDVVPITSFLNLTYAILITKQQIPLVREPFYRDYAAKHNGRRPFVNPVPLVRWGWGENQTNTVEEAIANKTTFMSWTNSTILAPNPETCSDSLVMYVGYVGDTTYRNEYGTGPRPPLGFSNSRISVFSEVPDFVVPIGEAPYISTITNHVEYLPVAVDFLAAKGCDGMLFNLIEDLYKAGIVKEAKTGQSGITGGEILSRRSLGL